MKFNTTLSEHVHLYNDTLISILDQYVPIEIQCKSWKPNQSWYNKDLSTALRKRHKLERQYHCNPENINLKERIYSTENCLLRSLINLNVGTTQTKSSTMKTIQRSSTKSAVNTLLTSQIYLYQNGHHTKHLAEDFNKYFPIKISKIRSDIKENRANNFKYMEQLPNIPNAALDTLKLLHIQSATKLIKAALTKSCELNPIPTTLLKVNLKEIASTICKIISHSLQTGRAPSILKAANVKPLLKK